MQSPRAPDTVLLLGPRLLFHPRSFIQGSKAWCSAAQALESNVLISNPNYPTYCWLSKLGILSNFGSFCKLMRTFTEGSEPATWLVLLLQDRSCFIII